MLCACSGEQFKLDDPSPQSPESLATRDFSASGISSSRTGTGTVDWESKLEDAQVDEAESTLKEALSLNYEEARALLGRLEYQRGHFDGALQVFQGIDITLLSPRMSKAIAVRTQPRKSRSRGRSMTTGLMSLHSVSLLLEAILLKAKSLAELGRVKEAAKECKIILDTIESAKPNGIHAEISQDGKLLEIFHRSLELLPVLYLHVGSLDEAVASYRRALVKPWNLDPQRLAKLQKDFAALLLYGGFETSIISSQAFPKNSMEESILLLFILMRKILHGEIEWDSEVIGHLTFALTVCGHFESLADHVEQVLPGVYDRVERWYFLALCYSAAGQNQAALDLLKKVLRFSEDSNNCGSRLASFLLAAKLCAHDPNEYSLGIIFARRVIDACLDKNEHILSHAHKFLGVCYGNAARKSVSDSERVCLQRDSVDSLNRSSFLTGAKDPEISFRLGMENAILRNLVLAFEHAMAYSDMSNGAPGRGWRLLALIASAEHRVKDAEAIVDVALGETESVDMLELLRLKGVIQIAGEKPKQAIETYRVLLALIQGHGEGRDKDAHEVQAERKLEVEAWLDLAGLYLDHELWLESNICIEKAKATKLYSHRAWHATGRLFEAQEQYKGAIDAFSVSLSIDPDYVPSIVSIAGILVKMGRNQSLPVAKSLLMNALRLDPTSHDAWFSLGQIYKTEGSMHQAADSFQAAHELKLSAPVQSFQ